MEAADDISYCVADLEDAGREKESLALSSFITIYITRGATMRRIRLSWW